MEGVGAAELGGEVAVEVTLMASCWPKVQCRGKVQVKKCSPAVERVILAGLMVMLERVVVVVEDCAAVFKGLQSIVDVGGGTGTVAKAVAGAYPELKYTVLDLSQVVGDLVGSENLKFVGGDMFEAIPPANAVLLKLYIKNHQQHSLLLL